AEVLENRLGLLRRIRARNVIPQRAPSTSDIEALEAGGGRAAVTQSFEPSPHGRKPTKSDPNLFGARSKSNPNGPSEELPVKRVPLTTETANTRPAQPSLPAIRSAAAIPPTLPEEETGEDSDARALSDAFASEEP